MQSTFSYMKNILSIYWGQSRFQLLLYMMIILILLLEKNQWKRMIFGWYGICCFIGILNPITIKVCSKIWGTNIAYYCRQFSIIPIIIIIGYGIVLLYSRIKESKRIIVVLFFSIFIFMNGQQLYQEEWCTKAENLKKLPNECVAICHFLEQQEDEGKIKVALPTSLGAYMRQYYNIIQNQGRLVYDIDMENALQCENPDVDEIMKKAGQEGCDFIITNNIESVKKIYEDAGYKSNLETNNYIIYKVTGVYRWKYIYNDLNQLSEKIFLRPDGNPAYSQYGYVIKKYTYNEQGMILTERFYDENELPISVETGEYAILYEYDSKGRKIKTIYCDQNDNLMQISGGYAVIRYEYNEHNGNVIEKFYDIDGNEIQYHGDKS